MGITQNLISVENHDPLHHEAAWQEKKKNAYFTQCKTGMREKEESYTRNCAKIYGLYNFSA